MSNDIYKLAGNMTIPEDKKAEFNRYALRILDLCGIRKTENIELGEQTITVVRRPEPDEDGIVSFDYSIFEKKIRETSTYNMNTCELIVPDRGNGEFAVVMNVIMVMQESYSETPCYFMYKNEPCSVKAYAVLIKSMIGIRLKFTHRARMWDMLLYLKNTEEYQNITSKMVWDAYSDIYCDLIPEQFIAAFDIDSEELDVPEEPFKGEMKDIKNASEWNLKYYAYQIMEKMIENEEKESLECFLRELLDSDLQKRRELAEDTKYGVIAEISLYVLPSIIVYGYAFATHQSFWDAWKNLDIKGYSEINTESSKIKAKLYLYDKFYLTYYKAIERDYEDECIEFWDNENLNLSDNMKECLSEWKEDFKKTKLEEDFDMEIFLARMVVDLKRDWNCRLVDKEFITEFMEHKEDVNYKRALLLYRKFMDQDTLYFPELTRKQAIQWVIRNNRNKFDYTAMSALQSLLINHKRRYEILGF